MKKLLAFTLVLGTASVTNAGLLLSVNGIVDPPDTTIILGPSDSVSIDVWGDGATPAPTDGYIIVQGLGNIAGHTMLYPGNLSSYEEIEEFPGMTPEEVLAALESMGYAGASDASHFTFADSSPTQPPLSGTLLDDIIFHADGFQNPGYPGGAPGDALLTLVSGDWLTIYDTQIIHIPEPMTVSLLVLGGVALLRKRWR